MLQKVMRSGMMNTMMRLRSFLSRLFTVTPSSQQRSYSSGFSLLELLVVISILGILMAMGVAAYSTAQKKGRDAKRRQDIKTIQNALEQYYANNSSSYPSASCTGMATYFSGAVPIDPKTGSAYICNSSATGYCACAILDDTTGGNAAAPSGVTCAFTGSPKTHYCLTNQQ